MAYSEAGFMLYKLKVDNYNSISSYHKLDKNADTSGFFEDSNNPIANTLFNRFTS